MKAYILTLGCKVNQYESQAMLEELCRSWLCPLPRRRRRQMW